MKSYILFVLLCFITYFEFWRFQKKVVILHSELAKLKQQSTNQLYRLTKNFSIMRKIFFLVAFLSASIMSFAYTAAPGAWIGSTDAAYANQFKWSEVEGVATPTDVVNIQKPGFAGEIGIYVTFADAAFNAVYFNGVLVANEAQYKQDGAGAVFYLSALTAKNTEILIKNGETVRFGLNVYNDKGETGELDSDIDSEYCGEVMSSGNTTAAFTWETKADGSVVITISEALGGDDAATHFRGNGISIDKFTVGATNEPAATYFDHSCAGNKVTLTPKADVEAPAFGTKIHVNNIIEYTTSLDGNAWPTLQFEYTYGGVCKITPELTKIVLSASAVYAQVGETITLTAQGKDQLNQDIDADITLSISPESAGTLSAGVLTLAQPGAVTVTAQSGEISKAIEVYCVPSANLALNQPCEGGYYDNNPAESFDKANDGNTNTAWVTYANRPAAEEWWYVDLGDKYTLFAIDVVWGDPASKKYILQVRDDAPSDSDKANDEAWETVLNDVSAGNNSEQFNIVSAAGRYVRLRSLEKTADFLRLKEVRIFGTEYVATDDDEAPVMVSASLVSKNHNSAVIAVEATDNGEVVKYHVVDLAQGFDAKFVATNGQITVTGLNPNTAYYFMIYAVDAAQNESQYAKSVGVTTDAHVSEPQAACAAPTWPAGQVQAIYSPTYNADCNFQDWGSGTAYTSTDYGKKFALAGGGYFGMDGFALNCPLMEKLHADIWIADDATLRIVPICRNAADTGNEPEIGEFVTLRGQQWNSIDLTLSEGEFAKVTNWSNVYQVKIDNAANLTIWLGNLYFYRAEPLVDNEAPTNVQASVAGAGYFSATLAVSAVENSGVVNFRVLNGDQEVAKGGGASGQTAHITVPNLKANTEYTFSVVAYDANDNAAEPVNVQVTTLAAPAPADLPTYDAENVKGVYTDNYTNVAMSIQGWHAEPAISAGLLAENRQALCITPNNTPNSCFGLAFPAMDITAYDALELDIYPLAENAVLDIQVIGVGEASTTFNLTANEWNHISLNIDGNTKTNCEQIGFYNCQNLQGVCFVQNVLFVQDGDTTAIENTEVGAKAIKTIENGQLIIIRDGKRYNVTGARVK